MSDNPFGSINGSTESFRVWPSGFAIDDRRRRLNELYEFLNHTSKCGWVDVPVVVKLIADLLELPEKATLKRKDPL